MKSRRMMALLISMCLVMAVGFAGCSGGCNANTGTSSSSSPSSSRPSSSSSPSSPSSSTPSSPTSPSDSVPPSSSGSTSTSKAAMGTDFSEIGTLSAKSLDWGPGGPKDDKNRSQGALAYQNKYGSYNALFIGPDQNTCYLTFDEGYAFGLTPQILDVLKEKGVKAIFFLTKDFVQSSPDTVRRMIDEGHVLGNHSWTHRNYSTLTPKEAAEDMMKLHDYVKETFDYEMRYFRFPSGNFSEQTLATVQAMGYKSVFWSFAYVDWYTDNQPDPAASADKIVAAACPGNIYLLHSVSQTNADILGDVIDRIEEKGFTWGNPGSL